MTDKFSEMPSYGLWVGHPQSDYEGFIELEKIKSMGELQLTCGFEVTYGCIDLREGVK